METLKDKMLKAIVETQHHGVESFYEVAEACAELARLKLERHLAQHQSESFASPKEETSKNDWVQEQVDNFQKFLDSLPDEELDKMVKQVEATGISAPTVEEYLAGLGVRLQEVNPVYDPKEFKEWLGTPDGMRYTKWFFSEDEDGKVMYEKAKEEVLNSYAPASKEKPDFEKMLAVAHREWGQCIEKIAALQEEIRQLKNKQ